MAIGEAINEIHPAVDSPAWIPRGESVKILIFIEANFVRGAAKSLLTFFDGVAGLTKNCCLARFSFSVATFHRGDHQSSTPTEFIAAVQKRGIQTYVIAERYRWDPRVFSRIYAVLERADPDIIQTNNVKSHALIKAAGVHQGRRWIAFQHGYTATDLKMRCYNQLDFWSLRSADRVVVPCSAFKNQLFSYGVKPHRARVLHNAGRAVPEPSTQAIYAVRERLGFNRDARILLTIGRMSREKGHIDLIEAMSLLIRMQPLIKCNLVLLGFGPELSKLRAAVEKRGLGSRVVFATNEQDIIPFLYLAEIFVLPSRSEGSPHVLLEAMGAGLPIVATAVGGIPEILKDGETAVLVEARSPEALASGLARMLQSPGLAKSYSQQASKLLESSFSPEMYVQNLFSIYADVLGSWDEADASPLARGARS